jgi:Ni/Co efflux regulator RcnB
LKPAGPRSARPGALAVAAAIALLWPALATAQDGGNHAPTPAAGPPAPPHGAPSRRPEGSDRPYKPSYGRWSPGQVLPPTAGAVVISDYEQFHLRRPPRGYTWMQCDGDFILANAAGLIFEVIPGGGR